VTGKAAGNLQNAVTGIKACDAWQKAGHRRWSMVMELILIILVLVLLFGGGGGYWGRSRGYW
jgi:hypothetical protein